MKEIKKVVRLAIAFGVVFGTGATVANAKTISAASCELSAVQAAVNSASAGDTVDIPAGTCTWTSTLSIKKSVTLAGSGTPNNEPSTFGAGTTNTVITDNVGNRGTLISVSGISDGQFVRISLLDLEPAGPQVWYPIVLTGTCDATGCPDFRLDNIVWGQKTSWTYVPLITQTLISTDNIFGVVDHNTVAPGSFSNQSAQFININHTAWKGVGAYGDNSWASPDTFGTGQAVYLENNDIWLSGAPVTENEFPADYPQGAGGGRIVGRFNRLTLSGSGPFAYHGTETGGRSRSGRAFEIYGNALSCVNNACDVYVGMRGGTGFVFGNTWTLGANTWLNSILNIETQRTWRGTYWSQCNGLTPYDVNDGYARVWSGTIGSITGSNPYTITVSGTPWTSGVFNFSSSSPGGKFYIVWDSTAGWMGGIASNTSSSVTTNFATSATPFPAKSMSDGDQLTIYSSTLYAAGTDTGPSGTATLIDSTKNWTADQWVGQNHGYAVINITQNGVSNQIGKNTSNTITPATRDCCPEWAWNTNDVYIVAGYTACLDQGGAGPGQLYENSIPTPVAATTEVLDPAYEWDDTGDLKGHGNIGTDSPSTFAANAEYYTDNSGGKPVECSAVHPCTSLSAGVAWGKLAYRPKTCTPGVGYFAIDQGSWNRSGNGFGQGQLFVCGASNTWKLHYTPYCYPHPLVSGVECSTGAPDGGTQSDAGTSADAGTNGADAANQGAADGGTPHASGTSGCGCKLASGRPARRSAVVLLLLGCVALVRPARRRSASKRKDGRARKN